MKKSCGNCANRIEGADRFSKPCSNCVAAILDNGEVTDPSHWKPKPMTNADRIRAMTDEELAHELALVASWDRKQYKKAKAIGIEKVILDILRQPCEEGECEAN